MNRNIIIKRIARAINAEYCYYNPYLKRKYEREIEDVLDQAEFFDLLEAAEPFIRYLEASKEWHNRRMKPLSDDAYVSDDITRHITIGCLRRLAVAAYKALGSIGLICPKCGYVIYIPEGKREDCPRCGEIVCHEVSDNG